MSFLLETELTCPACKLPTQAEVWSIVSVREDPELKDLLLGGELNMVECHACKEIFYADHVLIYHDPDRELMAFVYPLSYADDRARWEDKSKRDFEELRKMGHEENVLRYEALVLFGLDELLKIVEKDEEEIIQSEVLEALAKAHQIPLFLLQSAPARKMGLPGVLPYDPDVALSKVESVIEGLKKLEKINDCLFVYRQALKILTAQPSLQLPLK